MSASIDPVQQFEAAVSKAMLTGLNKAAATRQVTRQNPQLHAAYLRAVNVKAGRNQAAARVR